MVPSGKRLISREEVRPSLIKYLYERRTMISKILPPPAIRWTNPCSVTCRTAHEASTIISALLGDASQSSGTEARVAAAAEKSGELVSASEQEVAAELPLWLLIHVILAVV